MSYLIKVLALLSAFVAPVSWAQEASSAFEYGEIILVEDAIESSKIVVVYSEASGVVEIRFKECEECKYRALFPAQEISFNVEGRSLSAKTASERYRNSPGTVFFDVSTSNVNRVEYFQADNFEVENENSYR